MNSHLRPVSLLLLATLVASSTARTQVLTGELVITAERTTVDRVTESTLQNRLTEFDVVRLNYLPLVDALKAGVTRHHLSIAKVIDEDVIVEPHDLRAPNYRLLIRDDTGLHEIRSGYVPNTFILRNRAGAEIGRLNLDADTFEARLPTTNGVYYVRKLSAFAPTTETNVMVINRLEASAQEQVCATEDDVIVREGLAPDPASASGNPGGFERCVQLEIAGAGDFTLFQTHGIFGTENRVFQVVNMAESIYQAEFGLPFTITGNVVSVTPDPYTSTDSQKLLDQFRTHWNDLDVPIQRDIAILVSGKDFDGHTVGRAAKHAAGKPDKAYAIIQSPGTDHLDHVVAHEIGHSLGSEHDDSGCAHLISGNRWTMCSWVGSKGFSGTSRAAIISYVNANLDLFISDFTLTTNPFFIDGAFTNGELHAGGSIITQDYYLENPAYDVTLLARERIRLKANTRVTSGARMVCRIVPDLDCSKFESTSLK